MVSLTSDRNQAATGQAKAQGQDIAPLLADQGDLLALVKPQFELQPADISRGGLVKNDAAYARELPADEIEKAKAAALAYQFKTK